ncbi:DUF2254 domain-containing protein [Paracoccus aestuariivivens]|uniref:DUF2254 domain-containing protein n=1 Tax=Paracoccus aestuariivivens TaxID=1820333 RepID=A0A6L6JFJ4_9RHOB|nr:DUF2254 domain-containing protein [Paracoccus aestuariivivens]MTH79948.1 DUF2254 domain-containing protein [Paracoccus aestuariivivens]
MTRWQWLLQRLTRRLWLRASLIGFLGIATAALAAVVEGFLPWHLPGTIGADAVDSLLNIIASSMLAVTTFSLSVATSAYASATSNVTPRATRLLVEDRLTQNVLSTFVGSFLFAVVGIILLRTGAYGDRGRVVLFAATIFVVALIVLTLLRWIDHLTRLGRVGETTERVEDAAREALEARLTRPYLGGKPLVGPANGIEVCSTEVGYLQHIDMAALSDWAESASATIALLHTPGAFLHHGRVIAVVDGPLDDPTPIRDAFTIGTIRSFDQDPRFGLAVMSEIASRALSPAVNDPGTAIDIIGRNLRLLTLWAKGGNAEDVIYPRIHVSPLADSDLVEDAFLAIARDGAGMVEVQSRLQKALMALADQSRPDMRAAALDQSTLALARSDQALPLPQDRDRLHAIVRGHRLSAR